jgi:hypothetical protein
MASNNECNHKLLFAAASWTRCGERENAAPVNLRFSCRYIIANTSVNCINYTSQPQWRGRAAHKDNAWKNEDANEYGQRVIRNIAQQDKITLMAMAMAPSRVAWPPMKPLAWMKIHPSMPA